MPLVSNTMSENQLEATSVRGICAFQLSRWFIGRGENALGKIFAGTYSKDKPVRSHSVAGIEG